MCRHSLSEGYKAPRIGECRYESTVIERSDSRSFTLAKIRAELDQLAERRLYSPPTSEERRRWDELTALELTLIRREPPDRDS
jgi:hypothetical protein